MLLGWVSGGSHPVRLPVPSVGFCAGRGATERDFGIEPEKFLPPHRSAMHPCELPPQSAACGARNSYPAK